MPYSPEISASLRIVAQSSPNRFSGTALGSKDGDGDGDEDGVEVGIGDDSGTGAAAVAHPARTTAIATPAKQLIIHRVMVTR